MTKTMDKTRAAYGDKITKRPKLKYPVRQNSAGQWCVWKNRTQYFSTATHATEAEAINDSLFREGHDIVEKLDKLQEKLEARGLVRMSDPYGWRA